MISKYIDNMELNRVIAEGSIKPFRVKRILRNQGIILTSTNQEELAKQIYPIMWGCKDITNMKSSFDDESNYIKTSLIELKCECNTDEDIMDVMEEFFNTANYTYNKFSLKNITRINDENITLALDYMVKRVGRNILLTTQHKTVDVIIAKKDNNKVIMELRQASTNDIKDINKFLDAAVTKNKDVIVSHISLKKLTKDNKVAFFDKFNASTFEGWRFETVTKVELKKDTEDSEDEEIKELSSDDGKSSLDSLQGITSAILNGTSIRNNAFVQECLNGQFSIATMGYKFESIHDFMQVVVEVNFKYDDIKIDICKTYEYDEEEERPRVHPLLMTKQEEIVKMFQDVAYDIYNKLLAKQLEKLNEEEKVFM